MSLDIKIKYKDMNFNEYQNESKKTAKYEKIGGYGFIYPTLGLAGEAGEVAEKIKKFFRDQNEQMTPEYKELIKKELGDVLWYLSQIATELNMSFEDVAKTNLEKLASRKERGVISGNGDIR